MGSFSLSGGVEVFGFISPSDTTDTYPVIDPLYGIDGLRNVDLLSDLNTIPTLRRRAGMVVGVSGGTTYYKLNLPPWTNTLSDWSVFNSGGSSGGTLSGDYLPLSGGTVSGGTQFTNGLSANTISATTYFNLPTDVFVTGGTYIGNTITFTNNTGGTFNVTGITSSSSTTFTGGTVSGSTIFTNGLSANTISATTYQNLPTDIRVTGGTYSNGNITFTNNTGGTFSVSGLSTTTQFTGGTISGSTNFTNGLSANTISATTYQNLPTDIRVTGGTYSNGTATFTNNTGGTFNVLGFFTGSTDVFVTGATYSNNTFTYTNNTGGTFNVLFNTLTGLTVNGVLNSDTFSGGTYFGDGSNLTGIIRGSGGGRLFYFNLSNTQGPYYEFSPSATTQTEQSITSGSIASGVTSTIAGFLTPSDEPYVTILPGGIWSFYLHCYKEDSLASFDIFCEIYKRTSGGTETLLFQTDPTEVTSNAPIPRMAISDGYYSGTTFDLSDRILVKVNGTNTGTSSKTITFVTEGQIHYSYATTSLYLSSVDTFTTGFTYSDNKLTIQRNEGLSDLSVTINSVTGLTINGDLSVTGNTSSGSISATTYQNLPQDIFVSGGTYDNNTGTATFTNTSGGTFNVSGFSTGSTGGVTTLTTGVGLSANTTSGNVTIINTAPDQVVTLSGGTGITTGGTYPNFTITNSSPDQTVTLSGGTNISVTGTYPNFNISFTGSTSSSFDYGKTYAISNSYQLI